MIPDDDDLRGWLRAGDKLVADGAIDKAVVVYERVAARYEALGFALKATAVWKQCAHLRPEVVAYRLRAAVVMAKLGLFDDAKAEIERAILIATAAHDDEGLERAMRARWSLAPS